MSLSIHLIFEKIISLTVISTLIVYHHFNGIYSEDLLKYNQHSLLPPYKSWQLIKWEPAGVCVFIQLLIY